MDLQDRAAVQSHAAVQNHSLRDFEQHLSDLKKENFSLKLRIYFLEEKVQDQSPDPDLSRTNIELNVELQSLKNELEEKDQLLRQTLAAAELLSNQNAEEQQSRDEATNQVQESLELRLLQLQQELEQRHQSESSLQRLHTQALHHKDREIFELSSEKVQLQQKVQELNSALRKRPHSPQSTSEQLLHSELKRVMAQQSEQLVHCESTSELCLQELHDAQNQVQTLQTKIRISEDRNRLLQKRLGEMEVELRVVREEAQNQERTLHNLKDSLSSRELEVTDLLRVVEEQNRALCSSREQVNAGEAAAVQSELFSIQLALDSAHRALKTRDRTEKDLRVALERAESDLRGALERGRERLTHNQELDQVLDQTRTRLRDSVEQLKDQQNLVLRLNQDHNRILGDLKEKLSRKEQMVQDLRDLVDSKDQDSEVQNLRRILQEREQDLERVLLDRTRTLTRSQDQELQLQELLKDKHNDVQTQAHVLRQNQETIRSLQVLVRGLNLQVEQLRESLRKSGLKQDLLQSELNRTLSERDSVVRGLEEVLRDRDQEVQDLRSLLSHNPLLPDDVMQQLKLRLQLKDRLLQEVMSQRARHIQDQQDQVQELVRTIDQRDQYIQDSSPRFLELLKEQSDIIKELRFGLNPDRDQNLDQDRVQILRKTADHPDQVQQDLEGKNQLVKELVSELQRLRGRLCANCGSDGVLNLGLDLEDLEDHEAPEGPGTGGGAVADLGYETCEKSETEPERDTSPEFDDLEMCLTLDLGSHWWSSQNQNQDLDQDCNQTPTLSPDHSTPHRHTEAQQLQRLVQHLKSELNRSKIQVHKLQTELRSQSQTDPDLGDLLSRVESLEIQIKTEPRTESEDQNKTGLLSLVHLQARELSHLRQVLRESRSLVQILVQSLTEQLKGLESLLASRGLDHVLGQRLREQLQESHHVMERLSSKISLKELPEDPDDKTELLAMRLSKELQQKDLLIQSLRSKLSPDTPSDSSDQSDCISYVSDEPRSNQDEDLGSETFSELQIDQSLTSDQSERSSHYNDQSNRSIHYNDQPGRSIHHSSQSEHSIHYSGQSDGFSNYTDWSLRLRPRPIVALSQPGFSSSSLDSGLRPGFGFGLGPGLPLSSGALWDTPSNRPITRHLSPGASSLSGADVWSEHLSEVRSLRLRLEESIQTNERLRLHLETHLDQPPSTAPTNIYIQSPESNEIRVLRETNLSLKKQLQDSLLEQKRLREALLLVQTGLKEAELQVQRWAELSQRSQLEASTQIQEVARLQEEVSELRQEKQRDLQVTQRLQDELRDLQQELRERPSQSELREVSRSQSEPRAVPLEKNQTLRKLEFIGPAPKQDLVFIWTQDSLRLQKTLQDSVDLIQTINQALKTQSKPGLSQDCERLRVFLQEAQDLSHKISNIKENQQVDHLQEQVQSLHQKLWDQEQTLRKTVESLNQNHKNKEELEMVILSQLSRTKDVLRKAKTNLKATRA